MRTSVVIGTRPEIIKMSPVIRELQGSNFLVIHTGQHYSYEMDKTFFKDLALPKAEYNLEVGSGSHAYQTGMIMKKVEQIIIKEDIDLVLVEGDTNTVAAASLAAAKLNILVGHVEAGLRSFDKSMPEEINRIIADHVSGLLFAPTETAKDNLLREAIPDENIYVTGNTVVDALLQNIELAKMKRDSLKKYNLEPSDYFLVTVHRAENTDNPERLQGILDGLDMVAENYGKTVLFPIHPRTRKMIEQNKHKTGKTKLINPVGYLDFLLLEASAKLILTDSGGIQEEACIHKVPCVTLRDNTERPETLEIGANKLVGAKPKKMLKGVEEMLQAPRDWINPYGDGQAAKRIVEIINSKYNT
jgi:UDP-N-acetylglucosamine 2-epimerase (non-hydrolysing)